MTGPAHRPIDLIQSFSDRFGLAPEWSLDPACDTQFDTAENPTIVTVGQPNKKTPPKGACNTIRGLTLHAEGSSMAGWARSYQRINQSSIAAIAIDDFLLSGAEGQWVKLG